MTQDELNFEAYVVLGNTLHLLVNGVSGADQQRLNLPMDDLHRLHAWMEPMRANEVWSAVDRLEWADRELLAEAVSLCGKLADTQAEHLLGAPAEIRSVVIHLLLQPPPAKTGGPQ